VILAPGGASLGLAANLDGRQVADWFAVRDVMAFNLGCRLGKASLYPTPLRGRGLLKSANQRAPEHEGATLAHAQSAHHNRPCRD
jgi:hypothetical protein